MRILTNVVAALGVLAAACTSGKAADVACGDNLQDSARAARIALDTLLKRQSIHSVVLRYSHDSTGVRIVTVPVQVPGKIVLDGMGIVRLGAGCRVLSLIEADSA